MLLVYQQHGETRVRRWTLLTSKAEFVAVQELKLLFKLLINQEYSDFFIFCLIGTVGAAFRVENITNSQRMIHADICYHYV